VARRCSLGDSGSNVAQGRRAQATRQEAAIEGCAGSCRSTDSFES
jgi:hypothetical protein